MSNFKLVQINKENAFNLSEEQPGSLMGEYKVLTAPSVYVLTQAEFADLLANSGEWIEVRRTEDNWSIDNHPDQFENGLGTLNIMDGEFVTYRYKELVFTLEYGLFFTYDYDREDVTNTDVEFRGAKMNFVVLNEDGEQHDDFAEICNDLYNACKDGVCVSMASCMERVEIHAPEKA